MPPLIEWSPLLLAFIGTTLFGFVIGMELHSYRRAEGKDLGFGTTRTLTLLAVLGFGLAVLDPELHLYAAGLVVVAGFLGLNYWHGLKEGEKSLLRIMVALLCYVTGPIALLGPVWLLVLYVVVVLILLGEKPGIRRFSDALRSDEAATLAKFLIMAGLILPLLPDRQIAPPNVTVSYYHLWLAVIVVSGISYLSYFAQTYFFPSRSTLLTGVLGGLYSSTAATVVLGRRAREAAPENREIAAAIILATAMMYLRLFAMILLLGHTGAALHLALPFGLMVLISLGLSWHLHRSHADGAGNATEPRPRHPLEFSTALLFAFLFVFFAGATQWVVAQYGSGGLSLLSFAVGFSDIDPFVLSLLAGKFQLAETAIEASLLIASGSNNLLKAVYAAVLSRNRAVLPAAAWLGASFLASMAYAAWRMG